MADDPDAWHPEDALFVAAAPQRGPHARRHVRRRAASPGAARPTTTSRVLAALAAHAAQAVQDALAAAEAARHRTALEHLLRVSAALTETLSIDAILAGGLRGHPRGAGLPQRLGRAHRRRRAARRAPGRRRLDARARSRRSQSADVETLRRLLDPEFEVEGCYLLPSDEACTRLGIERPTLPVGAQRPRARWRGTTTGC